MMNVQVVINIFLGYGGSSHLDGGRWEGGGVGERTQRTVF